MDQDAETTLNTVVITGPAAEPQWAFYGEGSTYY